MSTPRNLGKRKRKRAETATDNTIKEDHKELIAALVAEVTKGVVSALQAMGVLGKNPNSSNPEVHQEEAAQLRKHPQLHQTLTTIQCQTTQVQIKKHQTLLQNYHPFLIFRILVLLDH